jgi:hypothetical protein
VVWCATDESWMNDNMQKINFTFYLEGASSPINQSTWGQRSGWRSGNLVCFSYSIILRDWSIGEHHMKVVWNFTQPVYDGIDTYPAGKFTEEYTVCVGP